MTDAPPPPPPATPLFTGSYVVPEGYPQAAARAFARFQLSRPAVFIPYILIVLLFGLAAVGFALQGSHSQASTFTIVLPIIIVALLIFNWVARTRALEKQLSINAPAGGIYELTLTDATITMRTPQASSSVRYDYFENLTIRPDFLYLKVRGSRIRSIVPRALYSEQALAYLQSRIPS